MLNNPDLEEAIKLIESWGMPGWGEYLCWELIQGIREHISPFSELELDPNDEQLMMLMRLRDEHKIWFTFKNGAWKSIDIAVWRHHASTTSAADAVRLMEHAAR